MAPTIKWQRWATYDWLSNDPAAALPQITDELQAWMTAVNANPSNVGRQLAIERDYSDSTSTYYKGFVISAGDNSNTEKGYLQYYSSAATTKKAAVGNTWDGGTGNGGYGVVSGGESDSSISWRTTGAADFLLCSDTTDGEEFFIFGPTFDGDTETYEDGFSIIKCQDGGWALVTQDGSTVYETHYFNDAIGSGWTGANRNYQGGSQLLSNGVTYYRWGVVADSNTAGNNSADPATDGAKYYYAANPALLSPVTTTAGRTGARQIMTGLGTSGEVYILGCYYRGPGLLVDLRP